MVDTPRTISALLTLLADNTLGAISEQDLRDLVVSFSPSVGGAYMEGNATATTVALVSTWYKIAGVTTAYGSLVDFSMPASNRLTYGGTTTRHMMVAATLVVTNATANQVGEVSIYKNGTIVPGATMGFKTLVGGDPTIVSVIAQVELAPTDYIELFIQNTTGANDMTVTYLNVGVRGEIHV